MDDASALRFSLIARRLGDEARSLGLAVPGFRSPPRLPEALRTIRRGPSGSTVSVRRKGRPANQVASDLVDGIIAVNGVTGPRADVLRARLQAAITSTAA